MLRKILLKNIRDGKVDEIQSKPICAKEDVDTLSSRNIPTRLDASQNEMTPSSNIDGKDTIGKKIPQKIELIDERFTFQKMGYAEYDAMGSKRKDRKRESWKSLTKSGSHHLKSYLERHDLYPIVAIGKSYLKKRGSWKLPKASQLLDCFDPRHVWHHGFRQWSWTSGNLKLIRECDYFVIDKVLWLLDEDEEEKGIRRVFHYPIFFGWVWGDFTVLKEAASAFQGYAQKEIT